MVEIKNLKIAFLDESIKASGLPMIVDYDEFMKKGLNDSDYKRIKNLANNKPGTGHNNALKGIIVQFDLRYPEYLSPEMQRYHWFEIVSSMSKMHRLTKMKLSEKNCNEYVDKKIIKIINKFIDVYNKDQTHDNFMKVLSNCPLGFEKWMRISTNYLQLKTIYFQRKNHKLKEWHHICDMINSLPYSELITGEKNQKLNNFILEPSEEDINDLKKKFDENIKEIEKAFKK